MQQIIIRVTLCLWVVLSAGQIAAAQSGQNDPFKLLPIGGFRHGQLLDSGAAEIVKFHSPSKCLYVVNGELLSIDVLSIVDPSQPKLANRIPLSKFGGSPTHVAVRDDWVAVAMTGEIRTEPGKVVFFNASGKHLGNIPTGALPDMLEFTPDGQSIVTANEGEPSDDYGIDPVGSISIIRLPDNVASLEKAKVQTVSFDNVDFGSLPEGVRIGKPFASVAQDLEPEYLTISPDSKTAWIVLQENNCIAVVDLEEATLTDILPLGEKQFFGDTDSRRGIDISDIDQTISLIPWPIHGLFQPDGIASFQIGEETFLITANEGDHRAYGGFRDVARISEVLLDPNCFPNANQLKLPENMGRLLISTVDGDTDHDGLFEKLYTFGARSFAIWTDRGDLVYDSGSLLEEMIAEKFPNQFNSNLDANTFDDRSDDKGPEPEGVAVGVVNGRTLAFVGIERFSGILVVDVTTPATPRVMQLFKQSKEHASIDTVADQAPEGLTFISADESPNGKPLLAVAYEYSGTTRIYQVSKESDESPVAE